MQNVVIVWEYFFSYTELAYTDCRIVAVLINHLALFKYGYWWFVVRFQLHWSSIYVLMEADTNKLYRQGFFFDRANPLLMHMRQVATGVHFTAQLRPNPFLLASRDIFIGSCGL